VTSLAGSLIRPLLRAQRILQRGASISAVRRFSPWAEKLYSLPKGVRIEKVFRNGWADEWLMPETIRSPQVLFHIHGGGFVFPLYDPERRVIALLARQAGVRALFVDYRLAPEHPFPAAVEDCVSAFRRLVREGNVPPEDIVFTGDSAGGNLAVTTMLALRDAGDRLPAGAASICPVFEFEGGGGFHTRDDPMLCPDFVMRQLNAYRGGADPRHPLLSPLYADPAGLPPLLIQAGELEILRAGAESFAKLAGRSGVPVRLHIWPGMWHFWHMFSPILPEAREAMEEIRQFIESCRHPQAA
jgi:monoterpene epsilon-lactone hydrolase